MRSRSCSRACSRSVPRTCRSRLAAGRVLAEPALRHRRPAAVRQLGDGRLRRPRGGHAGPLRVDRTVGGRRAVRRARSRRARRWRSRPGPSSRPAPTRSCRSRRRRRSGDAVAVGAATARRTCPACAAATRSQARSSCRRGRASGSPQVGALAAAGVATVRVARRPRVAVLATGSELRPPGSTLAPGQIYEANTPLLAAQLEAAGAVVELLDTRRRRRRCDCRCARSAASRPTCSSPRAGSRSARTTSCAALAELGVEEVFWRVAVRPGEAGRVRRPRSHARVRAAGQPGLVARRLRAVRPPCRCSRCSSAAEPGPRTCRAALGRPCAVTRGVTSWLRARLRVEPDGVVLEPLQGQESHMIAASAAADALVLIERARASWPQATPCATSACSAPRSRARAARSRGRARAAVHAQAARAALGTARSGRPPRRRAGAAHAPAASTIATTGTPT